MIFYSWLIVFQNLDHRPSIFAMCAEDAEIFSVRLVYCTVQAGMASCKFGGGSADAGGGFFPESARV